MPDADLLKSALVKAGEVALAHFGKGPQQWQKKDGSLLTAADLHVNAVLHDMLGTARPDYGWLSEEGPDDPQRMSKKLCWILDPIDGTRSFAESRDEWCVALALVEDGIPIISGVHHPLTHKLYLAQKGGGATCNGAPIQVHDGRSVKGARLAARSQARKRLEGSGFEPVNVAYVPQLARLALLAEGTVDIVLSLGWKNDWDVAAGALLVTEAGGRITTEHGQTMIFNQARAQQDGLVAAGILRHAAVQQFMETT